MKRNRYVSVIVRAGCALWCLVAGHACGPVPANAPPGLFTVPLKVEGQSVGPAILDTGGGFEVMLREPYGLEVVEEIEVLAFAGTRNVELTEPFDYVAGGIGAQADGAIIGGPICDCNGLGFQFFRKTGLTLALDFAGLQAAFVAEPTSIEPVLEFVPPPDGLFDFEAPFVEVSIATGDDSIQVLGLLDTGAQQTVMKRGLIGSGDALSADRQRVLVTQDQLGTISASVALFDGDELPDIILGLDFMRVWGRQWYFTFAPEGGTIAVVAAREAEEPADDGLARAKRFHMAWSGNHMTTGEPRLVAARQP